MKSIKEMEGHVLGLSRANAGSIRFSKKNKKTKATSWSKNSFLHVYQSH